jgi:hypothetical protein
MADEFPFRFDTSYRVAALPFGVLPATTGVSVTDADIAVRFGLWRMRTPLANIADVSVTGPYSFVKTAGPAHLSFTDRGVTFATNGEQGVCMRFHEPVRVMDPTGRLRHPGATVTVADVDGLVATLRARRPRQPGAAGQ